MGNALYDLPAEFLPQDSPGEDLSRIIEVLAELSRRHHAPVLFVPLDEPTQVGIASLEVVGHANDIPVVGDLAGPRGILSDRSTSQLLN